METDTRKIVVVEWSDVPPSINVLSHAHWRVFQRAKKTWEEIVCVLLMGTGLGRETLEPYGHASVTASLRFPSKRRRDSDNFTALLAKACGDAMVDLFLLPDDTHDRYTFHPVAFEPERGEKRTTLTFTFEEDV